MTEIHLIPSNPSFQNLIGKRFGRLEVVAFAGYDQPKGGSSRWVCKCDCGQSKNVASSELKKGHTKSCGCFRREASSSRSKTHGMKNSAEYHVWDSMIARCYRESASSFSRYGGAGIAVCERWRTSFANFLTDMGKRPSPQHSIDRFPDQNGNYEPGNCRWATAKEQARNRKSNHTLEIDGVTKTISEWAEQTGVMKTLILYRVKNGWTNRDAVFTVPKPTNATIAIGDEVKTVTQWSKISGVMPKTIKARLKLGWTPTDAVFTKVRPSV